MGSKKTPKVPEPYPLEDLLKYETDLNRYDTKGIFGGNSWTQGADGRWTQEQTLTPQMQAVLDQQYAFLGQPRQRYDQPEPMKELYQALMDKRNLRGGGQEGYYPDVPQTSTAMPQASVPMSAPDDMNAIPEDAVETIGGRQDGSQGAGPYGNAPSGTYGTVGGRGGHGGYNNQYSGSEIGYTPSGQGAYSNGGGYDPGLAGLYGDKPIGTEGQMNRAGRAGTVGRVIGTGVGALLGAPGAGGKAGSIFGNMWGDRQMDARTYMSPVDPNDPYGRESDPTGLFAPEVLPHSPAPDRTYSAGPINQPFVTNSAWGSEPRFGDGSYAGRWHRGPEGEPGKRMVMPKPSQDNKDT